MHGGPPVYRMSLTLVKYAQRWFSATLLGLYSCCKCMDLVSSSVSILRQVIWFRTDPNHARFVVVCAQSSDDPAVIVTHTPSIFASPCLLAMGPFLFLMSFVRWALNAYLGSIETYWPKENKNGFFSTGP